jgi:hypothetical protein
MSGPLYHVPIQYGLATADNTRVHEPVESRPAGWMIQVSVFMKKLRAIGKFHRDAAPKSDRKKILQSVAKASKEYQMHLIWLTSYNASP